MRVFVTGGTGFIGGHVVRELRARGDEVRALVRSPDKGQALAELGCELVAGDLSSWDAIRAGMEGCEAAIHGAAMYEVGIPDSERRAMPSSCRRCMTWCTGRATWTDNDVGRPRNR